MLIIFYFDRPKTKNKVFEIVHVIKFFFFNILKITTFCIIFISQTMYEYSYFLNHNLFYDNLG